MARIIGALLLLAAIAAAFKAALILLLIVGIISRTRETAGLLAVLGLLAVFNRYTGACIAIAAALVVVALVRHGNKLRSIGN